MTSSAHGPQALPQALDVSSEQRGNTVPARNHRAVREGIADVAVRLFMERGFVETTIDDIAAEAGISRRTYFRYFATKDDAVLEYLHGFGETVIRRLEARPASESPLTALQTAMRETLDEESPDTSVARAFSRLIRETPALRARQLHLTATWENDLAEAISRRYGASEGVIRARLLAAVAVDALDIAAGLWTDSASGPFSHYLDEVFEVIREIRVPRKLRAS